MNVWVHERGAFRPMFDRDPFEHHPSAVQPCDVVATGGANGGSDGNDCYNDGDEGYSSAVMDGS